MCGIVGFTHRRTAPPPERIVRAAQLLRHRGPDQQGTWTSSAISLGAVRLKIQDLAGGDQPMVSPDGRTVIVFNGEIYNHFDLRQELEEAGHQFLTRCDTETVLHAFLEWGTRCLAKLRGMFALAIWSEPDRRLVLARDRLGIKPLYLATPGGELYFASELKSLLIHPEIPRQLDEAGLSYYLSLNYVPGPYTLIEGISKLRPGHFLDWRDGVLHTEPYWTARPWPSRRHTALSAREELDQLLESAVREHLLSDVPLGVWASGGLDSTTIVHYAARHFPGRLKTFSVSFQGKEFDESPYFRRVAQHYGTDHHEFDLHEEQDLAGTIPQLVEYCDEPSADAGALPVWYLSKMCRREVTVVLSGEGADELFAGYQTYVADRYAARVRAWPRWSRRLALSLRALLPVSDRKIGFDYKWQRFWEGSLLDPETAHLYWNGAHSDARRRQLYLRDGQREVRDLVRWMPAEFAALGPLNRALWLDQTYYLADDLMVKCDRMSMAHSLEVRPAFLDHRIVEFANSLPEEYKLRGRVLKWILRDLMKDRLPPVVIERRKEGFDIPTHRWFRGVLRPLLRDTLTERAVREMGLFNWPALERILNDHDRRRANYGYHLWGLLIFFLWSQRWNVTMR